MFMFLYVCHVPWYFFNEPLHRDSELTEEAFDDGSAFCKLVLHLDVEDVCHQCHKCVFLQTDKSAFCDFFFLGLKRRHTDFT